MKNTDNNLKPKAGKAEVIVDDLPKDWRQVIADLPRVPKETLESIRLSVAESDAFDLQFQQQDFRDGR